ncbi:MAG: recombinase RecA [Candidatus Methylacidiphilales bacterium]|nr:recombinase RecA [Candidatus Methylacidiphilales bacterium]
MQLLSDPAEVLNPAVDTDIPDSPAVLPLAAGTKTLSSTKSMAAKADTKEPKSDRVESKSSGAEPRASTATRDRNLELAIQSIAKEYGEGSIMRLGDDGSKLRVEAIPTGCISIDHALGVGGFPKGRIIEVFGPESSGKTTLTLTVLAQAQAMGGVGAFVDVEHALDPAYAKRLGVNMNELLVSQPDSGEEALTIVEMLIKSNAVDVVVLDSVAALITKAELEGNMGDATVGAQARLMSQAMRKLTSAISKAKTVCIFTNQIREKIGVMFGNPETTPGGKALKFYSSVRIDIRRTAAIKQPDGAVLGNRTKIKVVKNKVAAPFREAEFDIMYNEGISSESSLLELATEHNVIDKKGAWLYFEGAQVANGRDAAKEELKKNRELYNRILEATKAKLSPVAQPTARE